MDYQGLLLDHLQLVDQIVRSTGRRRHWSGAEQDEFASFVNLRLIEDDYAVLRKFKGRSSLWTYLVAVIERLALDFNVERWGRWRPSKAAERLGAVAVALERLVTRDGHSVEEAIEIVRTNHRAGLTDRELRAMWEQIPPRARLVEVTDDAAMEERAEDSAEERIEREALVQDIERLERTLQVALDDLPSQDRVMVSLRFDHGLSVAEIAKAMNSSTATIHRRLDRSLVDLRQALVASGVNSREVSRLIGQATATMSPLLRVEVESFLKRVRLFKRDG